MNGHDDEKGARDSAGSVEGGIFSTPDLTIETENIPEATISDRANNKSRISAAFAQTDATQQNQALSEGRQNSFASTVTGDIKVGGTKKKSKAPLLIVAAIAVVAVVGGAVAMLMGGGYSVTTIRKAFLDYSNAVKYGPENIQSIMAENTSSDEVWALFEVARLDLPKSTLDRYYDSVDSLFDDFAEKVGSPSHSVRNVGVLQKQTTETAEALKTYLLAVKLRDLQTNLLASYIRGNSQSGMDYINSLLPTTDDDSITSEVRTSIRKYLTAELNMIEVLDQGECISNGKVDGQCETQLSSSSKAYQLADEEQSYVGRLLDANAPTLERLLQKDMLALSETVEEL